MSLSRMEFRLIRPRDLYRDDVSDAHKEFISKAYEVWDEIWRETFIDDLKVMNTLPSDDFITSDEIALFCYDGQPVAFNLFNFHDLRWPAYRNRRYVSGSPDNLLLKLVEEGHPKLMTMSYYSVYGPFRKTAKHDQVPVSEALCSLSILRFLETGADVTLSITRDSHKTNDLLFRHGGKCMTQGAAHGVPVSYMCCFKESAHPSELPGNREVVDALWARWKMPEIKRTAA